MIGFFNLGINIVITNRQNLESSRRRSYPISETESGTYTVRQSLMSTINSGDYGDTLATIPSMQNSHDIDHGAGASSDWQRNVPRGLARSTNTDCMSSTITESNYTTSSRLTGLGRTGNNNNHNNNFINHGQQPNKFLMTHHQ